MVKELWFWNLGLITKTGLNETMGSSMPQYRPRPEILKEKLPRGWRPAKLLSFPAQAL